MRLIHIWGLTLRQRIGQIGQFFDFFVRERGFGGFNFHSFHFGAFYQRWRGWKGAVFQLDRGHILYFHQLPPTSTFWRFLGDLWKSGSMWKLSIFSTSTRSTPCLPLVFFFFLLKSGSREGKLAGVAGGENYSLPVVPPYMGEVVR